MALFLVGFYENNPYQKGRAHGKCAVSTKMALFWFAPVRLIGSPVEAGLDSGGGPF